MPSEVPEPGDRAIVMWTNGFGVPAAVYVRLDGYAYQFPGDADPDDSDHWFNADEQRGSDEPPLRWGELCERMQRNRNWTGPFPLNVGELLDGGSNA